MYHGCRGLRTAEGSSELADHTTYRLDKGPGVLLELEVSPQVCSMGIGLLLPVFGKKYTLYWSATATRILIVFINQEHCNVNCKFQILSEREKETLEQTKTERQRFVAINRQEVLLNENSWAQPHVFPASKGSSACSDLHTAQTCVWARSTPL